MAHKLPQNVRVQLKTLTFAKAEEIGYGTRSRTENGAFLDSLAADPAIGGVLKQYMPASAVRTYIKDGILNAYAKAKVREKVAEVSLPSIVYDLYGSAAAEIGVALDTHILRDSNDVIYAIHFGTYLKWETALRKLLEYVVSNECAQEAKDQMKLCLVLTVASGEMSFGDQQQVEEALDYIGVKVFFIK